MLESGYKRERKENRKKNPSPVATVTNNGIK